jgi:hypothetical protein
MVKLQRQPLITGVLVFVIIVGLISWLLFKPKSSPSSTAAVPTPVPLPVNQLEVAKRPFVTLQPLSGRNELEITIGQLVVPANSVEATLEYDRNRGVLDAVLKQFNLKDSPLKEQIFLGSKSAGGHITYHEDVVGGTLTLAFKGSDPYALKVPWHYDDTQKDYSQLSTTDGYFQAVLDKPIKQTKVVVMQSPGAPEGFPGTLIAGPYLIRTVGDLPKANAQVTIRLSADTPEAILYGWDEKTWTKLAGKVEGKALSYNGPLYSVYAVSK